jgi:hypothetical protein
MLSTIGYQKLQFCLNPLYVVRFVLFIFHFLFGYTIIGETKKEGQRKAKRQTTCKKHQKREKLVPLVIGSYFIHGPSNVTCNLYR